VSISRSSAFVFGGSRGVLCHVVIEKHVGMPEGILVRQRP